MVYSEEIAKKISAILKDCCPAFVRHRDSEAGCEWHYCKCKAQSGDPCTCVWHLTNECIAGLWLQLDFIKQNKLQILNESINYLKSAQAAAAFGRS